MRDSEMDETEESVHPKSFFRRMVKWLFILLIIVTAFGYVGYRYSLTSIDEFKNWLGGINVAQSKSEEKPAKITKSVANNSDSQITVTETKPTETPVLNSLPQTEATVPAPAASVDNAEIITLKENQKYFALYLAARDLRDTKNNPEKFANELRYFMVISDGNAEIAGKIDILRLSAETGVPTTSKLRDDFAALIKNLEKEQTKGFWEGIKFSLGNLIRVTKIKTDAEAQTPREIQISVNMKLNENDLNGAIREAQKLGPKSDEWVREANNLARVYEITDYLVDYARNKIKF